MSDTLAFTSLQTLLQNELGSLSNSLEAQKVFVSLSSGELSSHYSNVFSQSASVAGKIPLLYQGVVEFGAGATAFASDIAREISGISTGETSRFFVAAQTEMANALRNGQGVVREAVYSLAGDPLSK